MFERYTEKARRTIFFARKEASNFGSPYIETEHLLLGLLNDGFLTSFVLQGISVQGIRDDIMATLPRQKAIPTSVDLPLSNDAKQALSYGAEEAERLADRQIRNQHLLLGLMRVEASYGAQMLRQKGLEATNLRLRIAELQPEEEATIHGAGGGAGTRWVPKSPGIPAGYAWPRLLYNPASKTLILEMHGAGKEFLPTRLFMRHKDSEAYQQIGNPAEDVAYESPVTCDKKPIVVFNSLKWDKERNGGDWAGVCCFNLNTKELTVCACKETLVVSEQHTRAWVSALVFLSDDGQNLYLNIGIEKPSRSGSVVNYHLARLNMADKTLELVSPLRDTFY
jgi:hypothetical protein